MLKFIDLFPQIKGALIDYKVHLATGLKTNDPLIVFLQEKFKDWQEAQRKKNFERKYIISLISYDYNEWLFAGIFESNGCELINDLYEYDTNLVDTNTELIGRLIIRYEKNFRQSYPYLENCVDNFYISQILKEKYSIIEFPGYEKINISFNYLQTIIRKNDTTWYTALQNVKGVYVITDKSNGKHYVGSVYGEFAFWSRWAQYSETGHGGNIELKRIIEEQGINYAQNFQFSILEIRSTITDDDEIILREQYWKNVLMSKEFGYNKN